MSFATQAIIKALDHSAKLLHGKENITATKIADFRKSSHGKKELLAILPNAESLEGLDLNSFSVLVVTPLASKKILESKKLDENTALIQGHSDSRLSLAYLSELFAPKAKIAIHPTAAIDPSAKLGANCSVGAFSVIGAGVSIGSDTLIGSHVVIEDGVSIGSNSSIQAFSFIGLNTQIGDNCHIHSLCSVGEPGFGYAYDKEKGKHIHIQHLGQVVIKDEVTLHSQANVHRGTLANTVIEKNNKIDSQCHIAHNSYIGPNNIIAGRFGCTGSTHVEGGSTIGGNIAVSGKLAKNTNLYGPVKNLSNTVENESYSAHPFNGSPTPLKQRQLIINALEKLIKEKDQESS